MHKGRFVFIVGAALSLLATGARAQTFKDVVSLDFSKTADQGQFSLRGTSHYEGGRLVLTDALNEGSGAFLVTSMQLSDYLASFDFEVASISGAPADGFAFAVQSNGATGGSGTGGSLSYTSFTGYNYGIEFNSYSDQGIENVPQIVGLDILGKRTRLNATALTHVDQGVMHAEVRVTPDVLTLTISGGKSNLKPTVVLTSPKYLCNKFFSPPNAVFFGFTAGTGGLQQRTSILNFKIQVPQ